MALVRTTARSVHTFSSATDLNTYSVGTPSATTLGPSGYLARRLYVMTVSNVRATAPTQPVPPTGWTLVPSGTAVHAGDQLRITRFIRQPTADTAATAISLEFRIGGVGGGALTTQLSAVVHIEEWAGVADDSANNGLAAIGARQAATGTGSALTAGTIPSTTPNYGVSVAWATDGGANAVTPDSGWTQLDQTRAGAEVNRLFTGYSNLSNDTTPTAVSAGTPAWLGQAMQIIASTGPRAQTLGVGLTPFTGVAGITTGTLTPTANAVQVVEVYSRQDGTEAPPIPELANGGTLALGWELLETVTGGAVPPTFAGESADCSGNGSAGVVVDTAGATEGQLMVGIVGYSGNIAPNTPAGWTAYVADAGGSNGSLGVFWRFATASEAATHTFTVTAGSATVGMTGKILVYDNADPATPLYAGGTASSWAGIVFRLALTNLYAGSIGVLVANSITAVSYVPDNPDTEVADFTTNPGTPSSLFAAQESYGSIGSTGDMQTTFGSGTGRCTSFFIKGVGAAATNERLSVFHATSATPGSGALTAGFGGLVQAEARMTVMEYAGTSRGNNGLDAFRQVESGDGTVTLATWASASAGYAAGRDSTDWNDTGGIYWTTLADSGDSFDAWRQDEVLTVTDTGLTLVIAAEVIAAGIAPETITEVDIEVEGALTITRSFYPLESFPEIVIEVEGRLTVVRPPVVGPIFGPLGTGTTRVFVATRGGATLLTELRYADLNYGYTIDGNPADGTINLPLGQLPDGFLPFKHELLIIRDGQQVCVGVPSYPRYTAQATSIPFRNLDQWLDVRLLGESRRYEGTEISTIITDLVADAMRDDDSPNLGISPEVTGQTTDADYDANAGRYVGDEVRSLAALGVTVTCVGRTILVRKVEREAEGPILTTADFAADLSIEAAGIGTATEVTVVGKRNTIRGTAGGLDEELGLVQRSMTVLRRTDVASCQAQAQAYLDQARRPPSIVRGSLLARAPVDFNQLVCGNVFSLDVVAGDGSAAGLMRLSDMRVNVTRDDETPQVTFMSVEAS